MIRYKLTDQNLQTYGGYQWEISKKKILSENEKLYQLPWLHCYTDPYLALILNPIHANIENPKLFQVEVGGDDRKFYLIEQWTEMTLLQELPVSLFTLTQEQKIAFAMLCMKEVNSKYLNLWIDNFISGKDCSKTTTNQTYLSMQNIHNELHCALLFNNDVESLKSIAKCASIASYLIKDFDASALIQRLITKMIY